MLRVDGSVSRGTYWATTCGHGEYQYHRDEAPVPAVQLDGEMKDLVYDTLRRCVYVCGWVG